MWRSALYSSLHSGKTEWQKFLFETKRGFNHKTSCFQKLNFAAKPQESDIYEGQSIEGFTVKQISDIPEFQLRAIRLDHEDTGAQYLHLKRDDLNNVFSINLRTTPFDSTGVPHILEHTTLCGSKKYPCRDPFFKMLNRSLATFMNAMTGPDYTLYPFATQNQRDYYNLMSVYMDAVFNPQLKESDFRQEGWRLEHEVVDDPNSPIIFKGVVFNEMKGALSENQRVFCESVMNKMLPSHTYGVISGGDPLHIPQLTYEQLKAFHEQYYHPSNARFYSYGNFPLKDHLKFVNESYLKQYGKVSQNYSDLTKVPPEKRWLSEKQDHIFGKVDSLASSPNKQSTLAVSYLCSDITNINETFVLQVLSELLTSGPNSAFYKSLVDPNIGSGFSSVTGFEGQTKDTIFSVGLQGLDPKDFDWVVDTCNKTIDSVVKEGFEPSRIEAILHSIELNTKHQSSDFGLRCLYSLTSLWNHDGDLIKALRVNDSVGKLKENLNKNPRFLQEKVDYYLKQNNHKLTLKMTPDEQYDEKKLQLEKQLLQSKLLSLTQETKNRIFDDGVKLRKEQDLKQNVDCLPTLKTSDLKKDIDSDGIVFSTFDSVPVQICEQPTNCLTYVKGVLNTSQIPDEVKPFIPLFTSVGTKMGTKKHNYRDFDQIVELKTGGLGLSLHLAENKDNTKSFEEGVFFSSFSLDTNVDSMFELWEEVFNSFSYEDKTRLETLMKSNAAHLASSLADHGHLYAMSASASLVNPASLRSEENSGLKYFRWLCNQVQQNKYEETLSQLNVIAKNIFNKTHLRLAINLSHENLTKIHSSSNSFVKSLQGTFDESYVMVEDSKILNKSVQKSGIQFDTPLPVSYTSKSVPTVAYSHEDYPGLRILCRLLSSKYLLPEVREKGGAYGAGARLTPSGVISFFSYRDPKPVQTFSTFDASLDWINKKNFSDKDIEEAKLGIFQSVDAPIAPGARGMRNFLYGINEDEFKAHRLKLMSVNKEDLLRVASKYLSASVNEGRVLLGPFNEDVSKRTGENWIVEKM